MTGATSHPIPFDAYAGPEPYVFVSYAHADSSLVFPEIERWHRAGYRIWYDEGIDPGNEWPDEIARALANCSQFLVFITPRAVASRNVRNEINLALNKGKAFLAVHLEETDLPVGLELRMGDIQAILRYRMAEDLYERKLAKCLPDVSRTCVESSEASTGAQPPSPTRATTGQSRVGGASTAAWHVLHPDYCDDLLRRVDPERVLILQEPFGPVDVSELVRSGCVAGLQRLDGRAYAACSLEGLLAAGRLEILRGWLDGVSDLSRRWNPEVPLLADAISGEDACVAATLAKWRAKKEFDLLPALVLACVLSQPGKATTRLYEEEGKAENAGEWVQCALAWGKVFRNPTQAQRCLAKAETLAAEPAAWLDCAVAWLGVFGDDGSAGLERCRAKAAATATTSVGCSTLAERSHRAFFNHADAIGRLAEAESLAADCLAWRTLADVYDQTLGDDGEVRRCLAKAEAFAKTWYEWSWCAWTWKDRLGDDEEVRRCLVRAEAAATHDSDYPMCAGLWLRLLRDESAARACMSRAESVAERVGAMLLCASQWRDVVGLDGEARRCMLISESRSTSSFDWGYCAEVWAATFFDDAAARRCLTEAEAVAKDSMDWGSCAESWTTALGDHPRSRRCLSSAESSAIYSLDWSSCAESWQKTFGDKAAVRRCLVKAEALADDSYSWARCADVWQEAIKDDVEARRCLLKAESLAKRKSDWSQCAYGWEYVVRDSVAAARCRAKEESVG